MESAVNKELKPFITIRWGAEVGQLSVEEARAHGLHMLECLKARRGGQPSFP